MRLVQRLSLTLYSFPMSISVAWHILLPIVLNPVSPAYNLLFKVKSLTSFTVPYVVHMVDFFFTTFTTSFFHTVHHK